MDASGLIRSYDARAMSSAPASSQTIMAPQYLPNLANYSGPMNTIISTPHLQVPQYNSFGYGSYSGPSPNGMIPAFSNNFTQQRPLPRLMAPENDPGMIFSRTNSRQGFVEQHHVQSPPIKHEPTWGTSNEMVNYIPANTIPKTESLWSGSTSSPTFAHPASSPVSPTKKVSSKPTTPSNANEVDFGTDVDTLMKAIQAKHKKAAQPQTPSPVEQTRSVVGAHTPLYEQAAPSERYEMQEPKLTRGSCQQNEEGEKVKKRYACPLKNCSKTFSQKTHLEIHERKHTGAKPYLCTQPNCGMSFSQAGNLKTHERRHTGERPYQCDICGKRFAQRGNVRSHMIVHKPSKPFLCQLDDCNKQFTQLGNLKSHHNKFHISSIRALTKKFTSIKDGDIVNSKDKELWEYFAKLYKNSNKGIKGRGKDRKVGPRSAPRRDTYSNDNSSAYSMDGAGMGLKLEHHDMMSHHGLPQVRADGHQGPYVTMYDVGSRRQSQASTVHESFSSSSSYTDVTPVTQSFDSNGHARGGDLAFGDRMY